MLIARRAGVAPVEYQVAGSRLELPKRHTHDDSKLICAAASVLVPLVSI